MNYRRFLLETIRQVSATERIVEAGTELYHGTASKFKLNRIKPGSYDGLIWTTTHADIAKTYIPVGKGTYTDSRIMSSPPNNELTAKYQQSLGIVYDLDEIEKNASGQVTSFVEAPIFAEHPLGKKRDEVRNRYTEFRKRFEDFRNTYTKDPESYRPRLTDIKPEFSKDKTIVEAWINLLDEKETVEDEYYRDYDAERVRYQIVNEILEKLGYEPEFTEPGHNHTWNLFTTHEGGWRVLPNGSRMIGRLLTIKPKRDLRLLDFTLGGEIEGDLMDVDYHRIPEFRKAEKAGYDGVVINDFAQSNNYGNTGHISYGLFGRVVKDLIITEQPATHDDLDLYK